MHVQLWWWHLMVRLSVQLTDLPHQLPCSTRCTPANIHSGHHVHAVETGVNWGMHVEAASWDVALQEQVAL